MVAKTTLQRYIMSLDDVILSGDVSAAENLQDEILAALGSDIDELKRGLENYKPFTMYSTSDGRNSPIVYVGPIAESARFFSRSAPEK
jgi:hypothetical protein